MYVHVVIHSEIIQKKLHYNAKVFVESHIYRMLVGRWCIFQTYINLAMFNLGDFLNKKYLK
jgi:hypothetical protein